MLSSLGKLLIVGGLALLALGGFVLLLDKLGISLGRLPGDIHVEGQRGSFSFPIVTCLLVSALLTLLFQLFGRR